MLNMTFLELCGNGVRELYLYDEGTVRGLEILNLTRCVSKAELENR